MKQRNRFLSFILTILILISMLSISVSAMQIFVEVELNDSIITLEVEPTDSIEYVKQKIQDKSGLSADKINLVFSGKYLEDDQTLGDYSIQKGTTLYLEMKHLHCVCGGNTDIGDHTSHTDVEFTPWDKTDSLPTTTGNYVLTKDVKLTGDAWVFNAVDVTICLNGHTITRDTQNKGLIDAVANTTFTICDCAGGGKIKGNNDGYQYETKSGLYVESTGRINLYGGTVADCGNAGVMTKDGGTFNMYGGEISWNRCTTYGGGVRLESGTFNMYSGTIINNYAEERGGGVYVSGNATFNMRGGTITQNSTSWTRTDAYGGGVFVFYNGTMNVSGAPVITDNKTSEPSNLHLQYHETYEAQVHVFIGELTEGANIGVSLMQPGVFSFDGREHIKYFTSDNSAYKVARAGENLMLVEKTHTHTVTYSKYFPYQIIEECSCGHEETATIKGGSSIYDGQTDFSPTVEYSEDWSSTKLEPICFKEDEPIDESVDAGSYVARLTIGDITAERAYQVERRSLLVKAEDHTIAYGEAPTGKGVLYIGFAPGEDENVLDGKLDWDSDYIQYGALGTYSIKPKGFKSDNYEFIYEPGTLTVVAANQNAPTTPIGMNTTYIDTNDGKITGVTSEMEYRKEGETAYTAVTGTEITGLAPGKYYVRYAEKQNYNPSPEAVIVIAKGGKRTPNIDTEPTASRVIIGGKLSDSTLTGGVASVPGEFAWVNTDAVMNTAGKFDMLVRFTPNDDATYKTVDFEIEVEVVVCDTTSGEHDFTEQMNDPNEHWKVCAKCGVEETSSREAHKGGTATCQTKAKCSECGEEYGDYGAHNWNADWTTDSEKHWHKCLNIGCTEVDGDNLHSGGSATCKDLAKCEFCDMAYGDTDGDNHSYSDTLTWTDDEHFYECSLCSAKKDKALHDFTDDCDETCNTCEYVRVITHAFDKLEKDSDGHWYICSVCGVEAPEGKETHSGGSATCKDLAKCEFCDMAYGELGAHGDTEIKDKKDATCTTEGYTGDTYCKVCDAELEKGTAIAKTAHTYEDGKCKICGAADPNYVPDSPQTGDNSNMALWLALLFISGLGIVATTALSRKKRTN